MRYVRVSMANLPDGSLDSREEGTEIDALFLALADEHRYHILRYFQWSEEPVASLDELSASLVEREELPDDRNGISIALHHCHLPRLADTGLVEYDSRSRTVRYWGHPMLERIQRLVSATEEMA